MKKLSALLFIVIICCSLFALVACNLNNTDDDDNNKNNDSNKVALSDLPQYMANINGASAFGILPKKQIALASRSNEIRTTKINTKKQIALASHSNEIRTTKINTNKNYLVMTKEEYDSNRPSVDENGLLKVTFSRIVTENATTEIKGTKFVIAKESKISFTSIENFTYSVYLGEQCVFESVCDNDNNDINKRNGYITLNNMVNDNCYEIRYTGIGKEEKITQDEIDGEIDKMYVMDNYTFVSFVPVGMSNRGYETDSQLSSKYDTYGYYSDSERQSFVIDNMSGYIYFVENNMSIDKIGDGLLSINNKIYDIDISENDELQFTQVVKNETLNIYNFFKDKYGNKYIQNDYLDAYDIANKTVYYTKTNYLLTKEGIAIHIEYTGQFNYSEMPTAYNTIEKVGENFTFSSINENESYQIEYSPINGNSSHDKSSIIISHIEQGYLYMFSTQGGAYTYYTRINVTNKNVDDVRYGEYGYNGGNWSYDCLKSLPVDYNTVLIWCDWSGVGKVYYGNVWEVYDEGYDYEDNTHYSEFNEDKLNVLLENCVCTNVDENDYSNQDWTFDLNNLRFRQTTFDRTIYYKVVLSEQGIPQIVNTETYVAPNQENIILQPINK